MTERSPDGPHATDEEGLVAPEGVNQRGTKDPDAPGAAAADDEHALASAPEPSEPA
jgi:hypothetical protein